jgi:hypothetical protein
LLLSSLFSIYIPHRRALYPRIDHFISPLSKTSTVVPIYGTPMRVIVGIASIAPKTEFHIAAEYVT